LIFYFCCMKDILDAPTSEFSPPPPIFSKLAFAVAILNSVLIGYILFSIPATIKVSEGVPPPNAFLILSSRIVIIVGFLLSVISLVRKEDAVYFKWIAVCINFFLMLFFVYWALNILNG